MDFLELDPAANLEMPGISVSDFTTTKEKTRGTTYSMALRNNFIQSRTAITVCRE